MSSALELDKAISTLVLLWFPPVGIVPLLPPGAVVLGRARALIAVAMILTVAPGPPGVLATIAGTVVPALTVALGPPAATGAPTVPPQTLGLPSV